MSNGLPHPARNIAALRGAMVAVFALVAGAGAASAQSPQTSDDALCVYHDRTYSEGAAICPQVRFMLMCAAAGDKLVWKAVTDRSLSDRCVRPTVGHPGFVRPTRSQRVARTSPPPTAGISSRCFTFNNKRYCE